LLLSFKKEESSFLKKRSKRLLLPRMSAEVARRGQNFAGFFFMENALIANHEIL
jgi:hypothetical protein